jgi:hypothetical protein
MGPVDDDVSALEGEVCVLSFEVDLEASFEVVADPDRRDLDDPVCLAASESVDVVAEDAFAADLERASCDALEIEAASVAEV